MIRPKSKPVHTKASIPVTAATGLSTEQIKSFIEAYEEKIQINSEIKSLEVRVQRGRIPRRKYKERKTNLENKLNALNKIISEQKMAMQSSGGSYADAVRQLDSAETTLNETDQELSTLEAKRGIGEITKEEYKKQLAIIEKRKGKAENTINGIMLRLRGEVR
ncbi:MAG: hypothetical protein GX638_12415, partial [Crenarchaeota archaeon]|nr:hypothetical protein [Thermoproteota archaeon]